MRTRTRLLSPAVVAVIGASLVGGCSWLGADGQDPSTDADEPGEQAAESDPDTSLAVGEAAEWRGASVTVTAVRRPFGGRGRAPRGAGRAWRGVRAPTGARGEPLEAGG